MGCSASKASRQPTRLPRSPAPRRSSSKGCGERLVPVSPGSTPGCWWTNGQPEFVFEYGEEFPVHIEAFDPDFAKVLVRYNPDGQADLSRDHTCGAAPASTWRPTAVRRERRVAGRRPSALRGWVGPVRFEHPEVLLDVPQHLNDHVLRDDV